MEINLLEAMQQAGGKGGLPTQVGLVCDAPTLDLDTTLHPRQLFTRLALPEVAGSLRARAISGSWQDLAHSGC